MPGLQRACYKGIKYAMPELHVYDIADETRNLPAVLVDIGKWTAGGLLLCGFDSGFQVII